MTRIVRSICLLVALAAYLLWAGASVPGRFLYEAGPGYQPDTLFAQYHGLLEHLKVDVPAREVTQWVDSVYATLSEDQRIGQLLIVDLPYRGLKDPHKTIEQLHIGGFRVSRRIPPERMFRMTYELQKRATVPLFFGADFERGAGRFNNPFTEFPSNMALGAARDTVLAKAAGAITAAESRAMGVNLLFAPVVDVNNNAQNPIINIRSYGEDPGLVGTLASAFVQGAEQFGVRTTLKHFPGHGNTAVDSHLRLGIVPGSPDEIFRTELNPYRQVLTGPHPASAVMTAHLWVPAFDPNQTLPATFSRRILKDILRDSLHFEGLIITDDVDMGAISRNYNTYERIVRPLVAGADIVLTINTKPEQAVQAIRTALRKGELARGQFERSVKRVLRAKAEAGLHRDRYANQLALQVLLADSRGEPVAELIARRAVTLLKKTPGLTVTPNTRVALVQMTNRPNAESIDAAMTAFMERLNPLADVQHFQVPDRLRASYETTLLNTIEEAQVVVIALYQQIQARRSLGLDREQVNLARKIMAKGKPVIFATFGNPYVVTEFLDAQSLLVAYDQTLASVHAIADILAQTAFPYGKLPISVGPYPRGSGLVLSE